MFFNAWEFFNVVSEIFLNRSVSDRILTQDTYVRNQELTPFDLSKAKLEQYPDLDQIIQYYDKLSTDLISQSFIKFEFYFFLIKISATPISTIRIPQETIFNASKYLLQTVKDCCDKFYPRLGFFEAKNIRFQLEDNLDPHAPDPISKEEFEQAMILMIKQYGIGLQKT